MDSLVERPKLGQLSRLDGDLLELPKLLDLFDLLEEPYPSIVIEVWLKSLPIEVLS